MALTLEKLYIFIINYFNKKINVIYYRIKFFVDEYVSKESLFEKFKTPFLFRLLLIAHSEKTN